MNLNQIKTRKKSIDDNIPDCLFWPPLPRYILSNYDHKNEPITSQYYLIPHHHHAPYLVKVGSVSCLIDKLQAEALYSMYNHFIDFLMKDAANAYEKMYSLSAEGCQQYNRDFSYKDYIDRNYNCQQEYSSDCTYSQNYSHDTYNNNDYSHEYNNDIIENNCYNEHTGKRRLTVFIDLSEGKKN